MKTGLNLDEYRSSAKAYALRGQASANSKLMDLDVINIRSAVRQKQNLQKYIDENLSNAALARIHGVSLRAIGNVINRNTWDHLV
jgi:hypothetical protein